LTIYRDYNTFVYFQGTSLPGGYVGDENTVPTAKSLGCFAQEWGSMIACSCIAENQSPDLAFFEKFKQWLGIQLSGRALE
jgi:hypothetical protein